LPRTAAAILLAVSAVVAGGCRPSSAPTDEQLIRVLLDDAATAAEERRVSDAVTAVSVRFRGEGLDRQGVKRLIAAHVLRGEWVEVSISGARVAVDGRRATAVVDAVLARSAGRTKALADLLPGEGTAHRFDLALEREAEGWRVVAAAWSPITLAAAIEGPPEPPSPVR
jgi:hypothetical protein